MYDPINSSGSRQTGDQPLTLFLSGDVMTGRGIDQVLPYSVDPVLYEPYIKNAKEYVQSAERQSGSIGNNISYDYVWGDALEKLNQKNPDLRIINFETAITTHNEPWPYKAIHYRMHPENAKLLNEAGIDICVLGNNHVLDWSEQGLKETLQVLGAHSLLTAGAGRNKSSAKEPAFINTGSGRLLVFAYTTPSAGTPQAWQAEEKKPGVNFLKSSGRRGNRRVAHDVKEFRHTDDRVIISIHWGSNWGYEIPRSQQKFAHRLIEKRVADIIYGHSSHHPRGIEVYKNRLILYGCGDLINDYEGISRHEKYRSELTLLYFPTMDSAGSLISLRMSPMKIHRFHLTTPSQNDIDWMADRLNRSCERYGTKIEQTEDGDLLLRW